MMTFAERNAVPPGGFRVIDPDTKTAFHDPYNIRNVIANWRIHRAANGLKAIENPEDYIIDWICHRLPPGSCHDPSGRKVMSGRAGYRTAESSVRATMLLRAIHKRNGGKIVEQRLANERAAICQVCKFNIPSAGCMSCRGVRSVIDGLTAGRSINNPDRLLSCRVNGVLNRYQVWVDDSTLAMISGSRAEFPDECWKKNIGSTGGRNAGRVNYHQARRRASKRRDLQGQRNPVVATRRAYMELQRGRPGGLEKCCGK